MDFRNYDLWFGVWLGILIMSLINLAVIVAHHDQFLYDSYMVGVSVVVLIVIIVLKSRSK